MAILDEILFNRTDKETIVPQGNKALKHQAFTYFSEQIPAQSLGLASGEIKAQLSLCEAFLG